MVKVVLLLIYNKFLFYNIMFKYISIPIFLLSFILGLIYVYLSNPEPTIIYVYPTPNNLNKVEYKDKADNCFQFNALEVNCPKNKKLIQNIPIQN